MIYFTQPKPLKKFYEWVGFIVTMIALVVATHYTYQGVMWGIRQIAVEPFIYIQKEVEVRTESQQEPEEGIVTAYSSTPDQTDDSPFITASNQRVRDGIVANNCLEFGTKVEINNKEYEVQDRMNRRYDCSHFDIWMESREEALRWGKQEHKIIVKI